MIRPAAVWTAPVCLDMLASLAVDRALRLSEFPAMYVLFFTGLALLGAILALFWLKDVLRSKRLARIVYSELVARFALAGAAFTILGLLLIAAELFGSA